MKTIYLTLLSSLFLFNCTNCDRSYKLVIKNENERGFFQGVVIHLTDENRREFRAIEGGNSVTIDAGESNIRLYISRILSEAEILFLSKGSAAYASIWIDANNGNVDWPNDSDKKPPKIVDSGRTLEARIVNSNGKVKFDLIR